MLIYPYVLPFVLALAMPGLRSLGVLTVAGIALWLYLMNNPGDGPAAALGFAIILFALLGLAAGIVTRATIHVFRKKLRLWGALAVAVVGLFSVPVGIRAMESWRVWNRTPSEACRNANFDVALGERTFHIPASPHFAVYTGRGFDSGYLFDLGSHLRKFCALEKRRSEPIRTTAVSIHFETLGSGQLRPAIRDYCAKHSGAANAELCRSERENEDPLTLVEAILFVAGEHEYFGRPEAGSYAAYLRLAKAGEPPVLETAGAFERRSDRLWMARTPEWLSASGAPAVLDCHATPHPSPGWLYCSMRYELGSGIDSTIEFRAERSDLEASVREIRGRVAELAGVLSKGSGAEPSN